MSEALRAWWSDKERERVARDRLESRTGGLGFWGAYDYGMHSEDAGLKKLAAACGADVQGSA